MPWDLHQTYKSFFYFTGYLLHTRHSFVFRLPASLAASVPASGEGRSAELWAAPDWKQLMGKINRPRNTYVSPPHARMH